MARRVRCPECNELTHKESLVDINETLMCPKCASQYAECVSCGCLSNDMTDSNDGLICSECRDNEYSYCEECGNYHLSDSMSWFNEAFYCEGCYSELVGYCEDCEEDFLREDLVDVGNNVYRWVCPSCAEYSHTCRECGCTVETLTDSMCEDCYSNSIYCVDNVIESYSYKPNPIFFGEGDRFYGVELETEPQYDDGGDVDMVREIQDYVSEWAYLKHDGSLCEGGFELVTHPMTLEHHIEKFTPELFKTIRNAGYVSHTNGNCGLHIHISRTAFKSDLAIVKVLEFVYGNYDNIVSKLGRRGNITNYCQNDEIYNCPMSIERILKRNNEDRYHAINSKNRDTIELRFFRGTLVRDTFVSALQFADVLVNLANNIEDMDKKIEWSDVFIEILKLGYEELSKEIEKRLDMSSLLEEEYEGYKIEEEAEKTTRLKVVGFEGYETPAHISYEVSTSICREPVEIYWTSDDRYNFSPEVLDEFGSNYVNRYELDSQTQYIPDGTYVQVMPLTMMKAMRGYGRTYPGGMDMFAGGIYKVIRMGNYFNLEDNEYYIFDRSSFRVLSGEELEDYKN